MSTMIQIRNVPAATHRKIKARAAMEGMSMSDWLLREIEKTLQTPPLDEMLDRLAQLEPIELKTSSAQMLREEREGR